MTWNDRITADVADVFLEFAEVLTHELLYVSDDGGCGHCLQLDHWCCVYPPPFLLPGLFEGFTLKVSWSRGHVKGWFRGRG